MDLYVLQVSSTQENSAVNSDIQRRNHVYKLGYLLRRELPIRMAHLVSILENTTPRLVDMHLTGIKVAVYKKFLLQLVQTNREIESFQLLEDFDRVVESFYNRHDKEWTAVIWHKWRAGFSSCDGRSTTQARMTPLSVQVHDCRDAEYTFPYVPHV